MALRGCDRVVRKCLCLQGLDNITEAFGNTESDRVAFLLAGAKTVKIVCHATILSPITAAIMTIIVIITAITHILKDRTLHYCTLACVR